MTWTRIIFAAVLVALLSSAASLWAREPGPAEGPMRRREVHACVCKEAKP